MAGDTVMIVCPSLIKTVRSNAAPNASARTQTSERPVLLDSFKRDHLTVERSPDAAVDAVDRIPRHPTVLVPIAQLTLSDVNAMRRRLGEILPVSNGYEDLSSNDDIPLAAGASELKRQQLLESYRLSCALTKIATHAP